MFAIVSKYRCKSLQIDSVSFNIAQKMQNWKRPSCSGAQALSFWDRTCCSCSQPRQTPALLPRSQHKHWMKGLTLGTSKCLFFPMYCDQGFLKFSTNTTVSKQRRQSWPKSLSVFSTCSEWQVYRKACRGHRKIGKTCYRKNRGYKVLEFWRERDPFQRLWP